MKFIDEIQHWYKLRTIQIAALGSTIMASLIAWPDLIVQAWNYLPSDLKALMPPNFTQYISLGLFAWIAWARVTKQKGLPNATDSDEQKPSSLP